MKKWSVKRGLSVLLCLAMIFSNVNVPVFAEEETASCSHEHTET